MQGLWMVGKLTLNCNLSYLKLNLWWEKLPNFNQLCTWIRTVSGSVLLRVFASVATFAKTNYSIQRSIVKQHVNIYSFILMQCNPIYREYNLFLMRVWLLPNPIPGFTEAWRTSPRGVCWWLSGSDRQVSRSTMLTLTF